MKILLGSDTYPPDVNGAARFTARLASGLAGRGHEVHVACPSADGPPSWTAREGVVEHRVRSHRWLRHRSFRVALPWEAAPDTRSILGAVGPDVVHVQAHFVVGRGLAAAAATARVPLVATNHFMPENLLAQLPVPRPVQRRVAAWAWRDLARVFAPAALVTAPTPRAVDLLARAAGICDAEPVSCGIDADRFAAQKPPEDRPTVLFVGRLDAEKRVDELLRAFAELPGTLAADLEIVGDGSQREYWQRLATRLRLGGRVRFRGFVSEEELVAAYARCAVFVMPGVAELQSLATLEAMAAGAPVVAADAMALPHLVRPGRNGWLYTPGDVSGLASRLAQLLADPALRARMGRASRELVAEHSLAATLDRFEDIYAEVAAGPRLPLPRAA